MISLQCTCVIRHPAVDYEPVECKYDATQEDMLCDECRSGECKIKFERKLWAFGLMDD